MPRPRVSIRLNCPVFTAAEVRGYLGLSPGSKRRFTWPDVKSLLPASRKDRSRHFQECDVPYMIWTLSPTLRYVGGALRVLDLGISGRLEKVVRSPEARRQYEGLSGHIHMDSMVKSRLGQYELGLRIVRNLGFQILAENLVPSCTIYLNGTRDFVVCAYSGLPRGLSKEHERRLRGGNTLRTLRWREFLRWGF